MDTSCVLLIWLAGVWTPTKTTQTPGFCSDCMLIQLRRLTQRLVFQPCRKRLWKTTIVSSFCINGYARTGFMTFRLLLRSWPFRHWSRSSGFHWGSPMSFRVFRSSEIDLWGHFLVVSLSPEWKLPLLRILCHLPPPPPAAERGRDLISLGWNGKICWWKWSGDSLCCSP